MRKGEFPRSRRSWAAWYFTTHIFKKGKRADGKANSVNDITASQPRLCGRPKSRPERKVQVVSGQRGRSRRQGSGREALLRRRPSLHCLCSFARFSVNCAQADRGDDQGIFTSDSEKLDPHWFSRWITVFVCPFSASGLLPKGASFQSKMRKRKRCLPSTAVSHTFISLCTVRTDFLSVYSPQCLIY